MSTVAWIILLVLLIPIIGVLIFVIVAASLVRVPSGSLGLVMSKGRATDTTLLPGPHFVIAFRRRMVEEYPSIELAYRAGGSDGPEESRREGARPSVRTGPAGRFQDLDQAGPAWPVTLGDRVTATLSLTIRFRLDPDQLRLVHERFGPNGIFGIVRDESSRAAMNFLGQDDVGVDSLFGPARAICQESLRLAIGAALLPDGIIVTSVVLGDADLGRTGEVIQATARARHEQGLEEAQAATRASRALNDAALGEHLTAAGEAAWRYRETDLWRDLVQRTGALSVALRAGPGSPGIGLGATTELNSDEHDQAAVRE